MTVRPPKHTEFEGIKAGDRVRLTCPASPDGNEGVVESVRKESNTQKMAFRVLLKKGTPREGLGSWYPIFRNELELISSQTPLL
jgi:hypothetical protein